MHPVEKASLSAYQSNIPLGKIEMPKRSPGSHMPDDVNKKFGTRLRMCRELAGRSQTDLGKALSVSFQQIQKYENGTTSISLNRLETLADVLNVRITTLLEGLDPPVSPPARPGFAEEGQSAYDAGDAPPFNPGMLSREKVVLLNAFGRIRSPKVRRTIVSMVEALTSRDGEPDPTPAKDR